LGTAVFTAIRWMRWQLDRKPQARKRAKTGWAYSVFSHESPLYRQLAGSPEELLANKIVNLGLACQSLDGLVLRPGESLSYWRQVGNPRAGRGFRPGLVLRQGRPAIGLGGGLCQLSNLLYWMTLHTPLRVTERWRHSYDVFPDSGRTLPFGSGATCVYNYRDLCIENPTAASFQLLLAIGATHLHGEWRSDFEPLQTYQVYEAAHWFSQAPNGAHVRNNLLRRQTLRAGSLEADELVAENHALLMYPPFLEGPDH